MATNTTRPPETRWRRGDLALLGVLSGTMLLDAVEVSMTAIVLPSLGADLDATVSDLHWTMSGFALGFGGLLLLGGRVVGALGRRRVYLASLLVFALASLVSAVVADPTAIVAARFVKGLCAALTAPTGLAIIADRFPPATRARAVAVYAFAGAAGFTAGLALSGALTLLGWRVTFLLPAVAALLLLALAVRWLPRDLPAGAERVGPAAAVAVLAGPAALTYAIVNAGGGNPPGAVAAGILAAALGVVFVVTERRSPAPLIRVPARLRGRLVRAVLGAAAMNGAFWGFLFVGTLHLQAALGWSALRCAAALLPIGLLLTGAAPFSARLARRFGAAALVVAGSAALPLAYLLYRPAARPPEYLTDVLPAVLLIGAGFALAFPALHVRATEGLAPEERGPVGALYQAAVQLGGAVVLAAVTALLLAGTPTGRPIGTTVLAGGRSALLLVAAVAGAGLVAALGPLGRRRPHAS